MVWLLIIGAIVVVIVIATIATYNSLVSLRNRIENAWAQIDVQLKRRYDLIPNLVETVKGYASHEQETLQGVIEARNMIFMGVSKNYRIEVLYILPKHLITEVGTGVYNQRGFR